MKQAVLEAIALQVIVLTGAAVLVFSGAAGWLAARAPVRLKRWVGTRPQWVLWLLFLTGLGFAAFALGLWAHLP